MLLQSALPDATASSASGDKSRRYDFITNFECGGMRGARQLLVYNWHLCCGMFISVLACSVKRFRCRRLLNAQGCASAIKWSGLQRAFVAQLVPGPLGCALVPVP